MSGRFSFLLFHAHDTTEHTFMAPPLPQPPLATHSHASVSARACECVCVCVYVCVCMCVCVPRPQPLLHVATHAAHLSILSVCRSN